VHHHHHEHQQFQASSPSVELIDVFRKIMRDGKLYKINPKGHDKH